MDRTRAIERMTQGSLDLLVVGGGITGAGIALDAASRGLRTGLVERDDFSSGTSSRSSKLIHGGLRYLEQMQFKVTIESSREKARLERLAPHLVRDTPFLFPVGDLGSRAMLGAGLWIYDLAAGMPEGMTHRHLSREETLARLPGLDPGVVQGGYIFHDARADDCRLVMHVVRRASDFGAEIANHVEVTGFLRGPDGRVAGVEAVDTTSGRPLRMAASRVVNATGVWCDALRAFDEPKAPPIVRPSKGVHLVLPRSRVGNDTACALQSRADGRIVFLIPFGEHTIVGTTDTDYSGEIDRPRAEPVDIRYLLDLLALHLPKNALRERDVVSSYAGLRPLLLDDTADPSRVSREHLILESRSGLVTITGGKLTTYRAMAEELVDRFAPKLPCRTHEIELFAAKEPPSGLPDDIAQHLHRAYGSDAPSIASRPGADRRLLDGLPWSEAEVDHAIEKEMALSLSDFLMRRTRMVLFAPGQGRNAAERVARRMAERLRWDEVEISRQIDAFDREAEDYAGG